MINQVQRMMWLGITLGVTLLLGTDPAAATDYNWSGNSDTSWAAAANWTPNTGFPNGLNADNALFSTNSSPGNKTPVLDQDRGLKSIQFKSAGWTLNGAPATMLIGSGGVKSDANLGVNAITFNVTAAGNAAAWSPGSNSVVEFDGSLNFTNSNNMAVEKSGLGTMRIAGTATNAPDLGGKVYGWIVSAGTLELNRTGTNALTGASHCVAGTGIIRLLQPDQFKVAHNVWLSEAGVLDLNNNNQTLSSLRFAARGNTGASNSGPTNGSGRVQTGTGTLTLTTSGNGGPAILYTGNTTCSNTTGTLAGRLFFNGTGAKVISANKGSMPIDLSISAVIAAVTNVNLRFDIYVGSAGGSPSGGGVIELTGANTFSNNVVLASNVTVLVNGGSIGMPDTTMDNVAISNNTTLGGAGGFVYGVVTNLGTIAPGSVNAAGSTLGTLTIGHPSQSAGVVFLNGSLLATDLSAATNDLLDVLGTARLGTAATDTVTVAIREITPATLNAYRVLRASGGITTNGTLAVTGGSRVWRTALRAGNTELWLTFPPPSTVMLLR